MQWYLVELTVRVFQTIIIPIDRVDTDTQNYCDREGLILSYNLMVKVNNLNEYITTTEVTTFNTLSNASFDEIPF